MIISDTPKTNDTEITPELVQDNSVGSSSTESDVEAAKQKLREFVKEIPLTPITDEQKSKFQEAIKILVALRDEVAVKRDETLAKRDLIKQKLEVLKQSKEVTINEDEFKDSDARVAQFEYLLNKMVAEIDRDVAYYNSFFSSTPPDHVMVLKTASDRFEDYIQQRIFSIRKYVKNAKRDVAIGCSRYTLKFDAQLKQIAYVENVLKNREHEEHSASQK